MCSTEASHLKMHGPLLETLLPHRGGATEDGYQLEELTEACGPAWAVRQEVPLRPEMLWEKLWDASGMRLLRLSV